MKKILKDNEIHLENKKLQKKNEKLLEMKLADEYIQMEIKKDNERKKYLDDLSKKIQLKMKYFDDTSKADQLAKEKEEEKRILKYQNDYDKKLMEDEINKKKFN